MNWIVLAICLVLLGTTIGLSCAGKRTLSQRYQALFRTRVDIVIFAIGIAGLCVWKHYCPDLHNALFGYMCGFWGHITFPNKERYKK